MLAQLIIASLVAVSTFAVPLPGTHRVSDAVSKSIRSTESHDYSGNPPNSLNYVSSRSRPVSQPLSGATGKRKRSRFGTTSQPEEFLADDDAEYVPSSGSEKEFRWDENMESQLRTRLGDGSKKRRRKKSRSNAPGTERKANNAQTSEQSRKAQETASARPSELQWIYADNKGNLPPSPKIANSALSQPAAEENPLRKYFPNASSSIAISQSNGEIPSQKTAANPCQTCQHVKPPARLTFCSGCSQV